MPRYSCEISYDGRFFAGWQIQPGQPSVQESLEKALTLLNHKHVRVTGAGRTDAGVHARAQTASFDLDRDWNTGRLVLALNANLPEGTSVMSVVRRPDDFSARFDAKWREYAYFIRRSSTCYPHIRPFVWWKKKDDWNTELAVEAAEMMSGRHNFSAFCRSEELPDNPWRRMHFVRVINRGPLSIVRVRGDAFLTNMVRIMVGNIDAVASGRFSLDHLAYLLEGAPRIESARTAPPGGLFFWRVGY